MDFYDKFVDRFRDMPKVKNPAVNKCQSSSNYLEPSEESVLCDYVLLKNPSDFTKFFN